jgi:hypothetical protein
MVRTAISKAVFDARPLLGLLMILLAGPACAGSRFSGLHAFHPSVLGFIGSCLYGFNCSFGFYNPGFGYFNGYGFFNGFGYGNGYYNGYGYFNDFGYFNGYGNGYGYGSGAGNAASISNGLTGSYAPDPVGADIPPLIIPKNCWVRRAAYDPSGAIFGHVLVNLCRPPDSVAVTRLRARTEKPDTGLGTPKPPLVHRQGVPE